MGREHDRCEQRDVQGVEAQGGRDLAGARRHRQRRRRALARHLLLAEQQHAPHLAAALARAAAIGTPRIGTTFSHAVAEPDECAVIGTRRGSPREDSDGRVRAAIYRPLSGSAFALRARGHAPCVRRETGAARTT